MDYNNIKHTRGKTLVNYLNIYIKKSELQMKPIIQRIKYTILRGKPITEKQFGSLIKFIEREPEFSGWNRSSIYDYFSPLMIGFLDDDSDSPNTLDQFFT
jgi:hypothetical protein|tara:strand:+ start:44 stop:343 length:300 start_codon:yes stop_codon:yes gene_type:complete